MTCDSPDQKKIGGDAEADGRTDGDYRLDSFQSGPNHRDILVIPSGDLTADFNFIARDDEIHEGAETVILRLSTIDDVNIQIENTVEVTIVDGDPPPEMPMVSLDPVPSQVREGETLIVTARLIVWRWLMLTLISMFCHLILQRDAHLVPGIPTASVI